MLAYLAFAQPPWFFLLIPVEFKNNIPPWLIPFIQNFSVELIGTWISVRLIDIFIQERERASSVRVRVLRNSRYWMNQFLSMDGSIHYSSLKRLEIEHRYFTGTASLRKKYLNKTERPLYNSFVRLVTATLDELHEMYKSQQEYIIERDQFLRLIKQYDDEKGIPYRFISDLRDDLRRLDSLIFGNNYYEHKSHFSIAFQHMKTDIDKNIVYINKGIKKRCITPVSLLHLASKSLDARSKFKDEMIEIEDVLMALEKDVRQETPED
ncbi:hypothetical protein [Mesorhizobium sp. M0217]|uniref:hypothetical protein n=1 Tax=unclassified Mesorhizobium TaxID=325217 RepID=UPI00333BEDF5